MEGCGALRPVPNVLLSSGGREVTAALFTGNQSAVKQMQDGQEEARQHQGLVRTGRQAFQMR